MTLSINQNSAPHPKRKGYWRWSAWLEGPSDELDQVQEVRYHLHHTYRNPERVIRSRRNRFRLKSAGYGEFQLIARVLMDTDEERVLTHWLRLRDSTQSGEAKRKVTTVETTKHIGSVFLSYQTADSKLAETLAAALEAAGLEVATANNISPGQTLVEAIEESIKKAEAAIVILSEENVSQYLEYELSVARSNNLPIIPVLYKKSPRWSNLPAFLRDLQYVSIKDTAHPEAAAQSIAERVLKRI